MTAREAIAFVERLSYGPNATIRAQISLYGTALEVSVMKMLPDVKTGIIGPVVCLSVVPYESLHKGDFHLMIQAVRKTIQELEDHERMEWFKLDGKCINDPHPELGVQFRAEV